MLPTRYRRLLLKFILDLDPVSFPEIHTTFLSVPYGSVNSDYRTNVEFPFFPC